MKVSVSMDSAVISAHRSDPQSQSALSKSLPAVDQQRYRTLVHQRHLHHRPEPARGDLDPLLPHLLAERLIQFVALLRTGGGADTRPAPCAIGRAART